MAVILFCFLSLFAVHITCHEGEKPNIVIICADDIGYNDVSLHGSDEVQTPNIDMLGYQGVIIENYYTDCYGTASASALLTGKYPMKMGTQGPSIGAAEDRGVPLSEKLLPSYLEDLGYVSHYVGNWRLGSSRTCYLPMERGFQSFYGCTSPADYYSYQRVETFNKTDYYGTCLFDNYEPVLEPQGHLTNVLTERAVKIINEHDKSSPLYLHISHAAAHIGGAFVNLQAPEEDVAENLHIAHSARRLFAGLVTGCDKSCGKVILSLDERNMLINTIIVFLIDNGSPTVNLRNYGSNSPMRGTKGTPWEGAVRSTALIWYPELQPKLYKGLFHVTDVLPTLVEAAGGKVPKHIDGISQWDCIARDAQPKRQHAVLAVDDLSNWGAFRDGDMKLIIGTVPNTCGYYGQEFNKLIHKAPDYKENLLNSLTYKVFSERLNMGLDLAYALEKRDLCNLHKRKQSSNATLETKDMCVPTNEKACLFNITADPFEAYDLSSTYPDIALFMTLRLRLLWAELVPRAPPSFDVQADPGNNSYVWLPWLEDNCEGSPRETQPRDYPLKLTSDEFHYFMRLNKDVMEQKMSNFMTSLTNAYLDSVGGML